MIQNQLIKLIEMQSPLDDVILEYDPDLPKGPYLIKLVFSELSVYIGIDQSDDTIIINTNKPLDVENGSCIEVRDKRPWSSFIGYRVQWLWELKNHLGYSDGVQFEFSDQKGCIIGALQFIAQASTISIRSVVYH